MTYCRSLPLVQRKETLAGLKRERNTLRRLLEEAEQALEAIRTGSVDAIVVSDKDAERVFSLRGADDAHRDLLDGLNEAALMLTTDGTILYCNERFQEMSRLPAEHLLGSSLFEVVPKAEAHALETALAEAVRRPTRGEFHILGPEGSHIPTLFSINGLKSEGMATYCMVITDISELKQAEDALHRSERHYRSLYEEGVRLQEELQRLSGEILRIQEQERRRISRDIHDEIGQTLTAISLNLRSLQHEPVSDGARKSLESVQALVDKASEFIHVFSHQIHPSMIEDLGLYPAVRSFIREFEKNSGLRVTLHLQGTPNAASIDQKAAIYRVLQECLTNVLKHSGVRSASVTIQKTPTLLELRVVDSGKGFASTTTGENGRRAGVGILGMRERVRALGGMISIVSRPGKGTRVQVRLPVKRGRV